MSSKNAAKGSNNCFILTAQRAFVDLSNSGYIVVVHDSCTVDKIMSMGRSEEP